VWWTDTYTDAHTCCVCLSVRRLSVWRPSVAYIVPKSRTERHRKTKIGTEVAATSHMTRTPLSRSKISRSGGCSDGRRPSWPWETAATLPSVQPREAFRRQQGEEESGGCISWRLPTYSLFILTASVGRIVFGANRLCGESSVGRDVHGAKRPWGETSLGRNVLPWGEVSMGRNVRGAKSPNTIYTAVLW